jgi:hypothetical protein
MIARSAALLAASLALPLTDAAAGAATAPHRAPDDYPQIRRELTAGAAVVQAALADALPEELRVSDVEAVYLAGQGVLLPVELRRPWFHRSDGELHLDGIDSLEQLPDLVRDLLEQLDRALATPFETQPGVDPGAGAEEVRDRLDAVRTEQRALRAALTARRRALLDADAARARVLREEIGALEEQLAAATREERTLERRLARLDPAGDPEGDAPRLPAELDRSVATAVCSYGAGFDSVDGAEHLDVLVRLGDTRRVYVFELTAVRRCQAGGIDTDMLLQESRRYDG